MERIDVLVNLTIRFTQPPHLNDPFESCPLMDRGNFKQPHEYGKNHMKYQSRYTGILSLSRNFRNLLMWTHYGDEHRGFVIGFDKSHEFLCQNDVVRKSNETPSSGLFDVIYSTERSVIRNDDNNDNYFKKMLCEKPIDWAYEEEVRAFRPLNGEGPVDWDNPNQEPTKFPIKLFDIPKSAIKGIFLGAQMKDCCKRDIYQVLQEHNLLIPIYVMKMSKDKYELDYEKFNINQLNLS